MPDANLPILLNGARTVLLFHKMTPGLAVFARACAQVGFPSIYFDPTEPLRSPAAMAELARGGVIQIDYAALPGFDAYARHKVLARWASAAVDALFPPDVAEHAGALLPAVPGRGRKLRAMVHDVAVQALRTHASVGAVAEYLQGKGYRCRVWPMEDAIAALLFNRFTQLPTIAPAILVAGYVLVKRTSWRVLRRVFARVARTAQALEPIVRSETLPRTAPPLNAPVLMFPHQGPRYGDLFDKNQYYASDDDSKLAKVRICHVEIEGSYPAAREASILESYRAIGVSPHILRIPRLPQAAGRWLSALSAGRSLGLGVAGSLVLEIVRGRVARGIVALAAFPNARLAMLGYEYLFPVPLAYALQARGVRVIATQERMMQCFIPGWTAILDEYFVHGAAARDALAMNPLACIDAVHPIGDVRVSEFAADRARLPSAPAGYGHVTLVLDWHSEGEAAENAQNPTNNWANNKLFYRDIVALARRFPRSYFILRGKNADWRKIADFADIRAEMSTLPNIELNEDYSRPLVSYELAMTADSVIARYTSLGDQCMAIGKPVIYHDAAVNAGPLVRSIMDFNGHPVIAADSETLGRLYERIIARGHCMPEDERGAFAARFFNSPLPEGGPRVALMARLETLAQ